MASSILRSIYRQAARCNRAGNSAVARSGDWVIQKARSPNFVGSPMSTAAAPWLMLPPEFGGNVFNRLFDVGGKMDYKFYSLADNEVISVSKRSSIGEEKLKLYSELKTVLVGSSHGWLALYNAQFKFDLYLYNPLSHRQIKLPSIETIPLAEDEIHLAEDAKDLIDCFGRPMKVILSCPPPNKDEQDDSNAACRAIMCVGPRRRMAFCWPGRSSKWTPFGAQFYENEYGKDRIHRHYADFVYSSSQKQLFCVTELTNEVESWEIEDPAMSPKLNWKKTYPNSAGRSDQDYQLKKYLVFSEHYDKLFLVLRHVLGHMGPDKSCAVRPIVPYKTVGFDVCEIDREKGELREMDGKLDGMALFVGDKGHGFVVESPGTMKLKPDSIYFTDAKGTTPPYNRDNWSTYGGHDIGIFDYGSRTVSPCYYPCDVQKVERIHPAPMWFTPSPSPSPV